jgi:hypothetical protein
MLALYRALTSLRAAHVALTAGDYRSISVDADGVFAYERSTGDERMIVALNLRSMPVIADLGAIGGGQAEILLATGLDRAGRASLRSLRLSGDEGVVLRLAAPG